MTALYKNIGKAMIKFEKSMNKISRNNLDIKIPVKLWPKKKSQKNNVQQYPCLCEAISSTLFWNRLLGILPVVALKPTSHVSMCKFEMSTSWMMYSYFLQALFIPYTITAGALRISCGPTPNHTGSDWYVMTFGYIISDIDIVIILISGVVCAKNICKILEILTAIPGPIGELRDLKKIMKIALFLIFLVFSTMFCSFSYVAWTRHQFQPKLDLVCHMLDRPLGVMIRGSTHIFPGVHISLVIVLCLLVSSKFQRLADTTLVTLEANVDTLHPNSEVVTTIEESIPSATIQGLNQLAETHRKVTACLQQINKSVGLQVLAEVTTNLYTIVYYLYRYSTADSNTIASNNREKGHYIISLMYRVTKLLVYITLGHTVASSSTKPLEALQRARIINLPTRLQQQVQTLILQWSGRKMALSAFGVVNVGPWLMAPIVGNVITYLLVALQFEKPVVNSLSPNVTAILETIF